MDEVFFNLSFSKAKIIVTLLLCFVTLSQLWGCTNSEKADLLNKPINSQTDNKNSSNKPVNIAEENFKKEWQSKYESNVAELEKHRKLWQEKQILNYDFTITKWTGGVYSPWNRTPVIIKVRNGEKDSIEKVEKGEDTLVSRTDGFEDFDTIEKLFDYLGKSLDKGCLIGGKYNKTLNYPQQINIIFSYEIHGHSSITIQKLEEK